MVAAAWSEMEPERDARGGDSPPMAILASELRFGECMLREAAAGSTGGDEGGSEFKSGAMAVLLLRPRLFLLRDRLLMVLLGLVGVLLLGFSGHASELRDVASFGYTSWRIDSALALFCNPVTACP